MDEYVSKSKKRTRPIKLAPLLSNLLKGAG